MLFWVLAAVMTAAVVAFVLRPLLRSDDPIDRADFDLAVYRDQLAEVDRDLDRGLIVPSEAEAARAEIGRRALAVDKRRIGFSGGAHFGRMAVFILAILVPVGVLTVYLTTGSPELPSQPFVQRDSAPVEALAADLATAQTLARRLQEEPEDIDGWVELGARYADLDRWGEAAAAYARAAGLVGGIDPGISGAWAEAAVNANDGAVTREARLAFEQVLEARPGDPRARYYLALATAQQGDGLAALGQWSDLALDTPPGASWAAALRARIEQTATDLGIDPQPYLVGPAMLGDDGLAAIANMTEDQRAAMVEGMVDNLAARLDETPDDVDGWLRLANAYQVLGRTADADNAVNQAIEHAPSDPVALSRLADFLLAEWRGGPLPGGLIPVLERLIAVSPDDPRALLFLGEAAAMRNDNSAARVHWTRLQSLLEPGTAEHEAVGERLDGLAAP